MGEELNETTIAEWSRRSRVSQGLSPKIEDPAVLSRIITLAFAPMPKRRPVDVDQAEEVDDDDQVPT
jgi:hypothetical protein